MKLENRIQLDLLREQCQEKRNKEVCKILVCGGTGCLAGGSDKIFDKLCELTADMDHVEVKFGAEIAHGNRVGVKKSGCHGFLDNRNQRALFTCMTGYNLICLLVIRCI